MTRVLTLGFLLLFGAGCTCRTGVSSATGHLDVAPSALDFLDVSVGGSATRLVTLTNTGQGQLTITGTSFTGDQRAVFSVGPRPAHLEVGETQVLAVIYRAPSTPGSDAAVLVISLEASDEPEAQVAIVARTVPQAVTDAGPDFDAGAGDSGVADSGAADAGLTDAGVNDAGTSDSDGGSLDAGALCGDGGTGCQPMMVQAYDGFSCALLEDGRVQCWGLIPDSCCTAPYWRYQGVTEVPLPLTGPRLSLEGGRGTLCVRQNQGPVACWGSEVRPGGTLSLISALSSNVEHVWGGESYLCALRSDAGVECWGAGVRIVDGAGPDAYPFPDVTAPTAVAGFGPANEISVGFEHICDRDGTSLKCWGYNSTNNMCPMGASPGVRLPGIVQPISTFDAGVTALVVHDRGTCIVDGTGDVWCWGSNLGPTTAGQGQVYFGCSATKLTGFGGPVVSLCSGGQHACALEASGSVRCWGENYGKGLLGYVLDSGVYDDGRNTPQLVPGISNAVQLSCGSVHSCVLTADHRVLCWGDNHAFGVTYGGLGYADAGLPFSATPVQVPLLP